MTFLVTLLTRSDALLVLYTVTTEFWGSDSVRPLKQSPNCERCSCSFFDGRNGRI